MKKIFYFIASAIVALGAVACQNDINEGVTPEQEGFSINVTIADQTRVALGDLNEETKQRKLTFTDGDVLVVREEYQKGTNYFFTYTKGEGDVYTFTCEQEGVNSLVGKTPYVFYLGGLHEQADDLKTYGAFCNTAAENISGIGMSANPTCYSGKFGDKDCTISLQTLPVLKFTAQEAVTISSEDNASLFFVNNSWANTYTTTTIGEIYLPVISSGSDCTVTVTTESGFNKSFTKTLDWGKIYNLGTIEAPAPEVVEVTATLSFANKAQRTTFDKNKQVWVQNNIELRNEKAASTNDVADYANPARFYQGSNIIVTAPDNITKIVFDCNSPSYATALKNSIGNTATVSSDKVTVTLDGTSNTFTIAKLTGQVRMDAITVTYGSDDRNAQSISFPEDEYTVTIGEEFEAPTVEGAVTTVTYSSDNEAIATVDENTGAVTLEGKTGSVTITATAAENKNYKGATASYTLVVKSASLAGTGEGTKNSPYDVTRAIAKIDENAELDVKYYVKGTISEITKFDSQYNSLTYKITDGEKTLEVYSGKNLDNTNFKATTDLHVGDVVVVYGTLKKFNSTYEFDYNNYIVSRECGHTDLEQTIKFENAPENVEVGKTVTVSASAINAVTYSSSNTSIATVDANGVVKGIAEGTVTITATAAAGNGYAQATATHTIEVVAASTGGDSNEPVILFSEDFASVTVGNNTDSNGSSNAWAKNSNFSSATNVYSAGGAVKLGKSSAAGTLVTKTLDLSGGTITVSVDVKGWSSVEGKLNIKIGNTQKQITYTEKMSNNFGSYTVTFSASEVGTNNTVTIATSAIRAFVDNIIITKN